MCIAGKGRLSACSNELCVCVGGEIQCLHQLNYVCVWEDETECLHSVCVCVEREDGILALINTMCMCVGREIQLLALIIVMCVCGKRLRDYY